MLRLKLQYYGHLMQTADSLEKTLMLGKIEGKRRRGQQRMRWLDSITDSMNLNKLWEMRGRGQRSLASYSPQCSRESEAIYKLKNNKNNKRCIIRSRVARMGEPGV